jgi:hypothetical protein
MPHRTPPAADLFELWREASALAQPFDEAVLTTAPEAVDFVVLARAPRLQHKAPRLLASTNPLTKSAKTPSTTVMRRLESTGAE